MLRIWVDKINMAMAALAGTCFTLGNEIVALSVQVTF
jgi:hypothetical protein